VGQPASFFHSQGNILSDLKQHLIQNSNGTITLGTSQDVSGILAQNQIEANYNLNRKTGDNTWGRKVATIPTGVINQWCKEWGITMHQLNSDPEYKAKMMMRLRSKDYLKLRTDYGSI